MKKVLFALAAAVLVSAPAFAAVQNVKVSGDIDSTYVNRNHFSLGTKTLSGAGTGIEQGLAHQSVFLTQARLRVDADLSDNVSTTVGLINERAWGAEGDGTSTTTDVDLYLAYATLREFLYSPLTVSVGRQVFHYGNGFIIGDGGENNSSSGHFRSIANDLTKRTSYDGIKAILDYKPLTLDMLYFKNNSGTLTGNLDANKDDSDVYGVVANYQLGDEVNTTFESYFFARITGDRNTSVHGSLTSNKGDLLYVPGLRVSTNPLKGLNVQGEIAWQLGHKGVTSGGSTPNADEDNVRREAMAYQVMASYALENQEKYKPVINASYTHVSGDKNAGDNRSSTLPENSRTVYTAWDPFNEAQGSGKIYNAIFDLTNLNILSAGVSATPVEDVTAAFTWSNLWADKKYGSSGGLNNSLTFNQPDGSSVSPATSGRKDMGNEYDVDVNYAYTEDVTIGVSMGWFVPGKMFTGANDTTASQALAHVLVNF